MTNFNRVLRIINIFLTILNITLLLLYHRETQEFAFISKEVNDSKRLLNLNDFEYIIPKKCELNAEDSNEKLPALVILIHTAPLHFELRKALRETWLYSDKRVLPYFMLGRTESKALQNQIIEEDRKHNDLIQGNFIDSYHNLTYKHTMILKWFSSQCNNVKYLIKMDDDVFANLPEIFDYLEYASSQNYSLIGGLFLMQPSRSGKYDVTREQFRDSEYPESAFGPSLIYSSQFVKDAYETSYSSRFFWLDDVFVTGFIRQQLHVKLIDITDQILSSEETHNFDEKAVNFTISNFLFSYNGLQPDELYKMWKKYETFRLQF